MQTQAEIGQVRLQVQGLEETRKHPPLEPSGRAQPCGHLDFGLLASRIFTE